MWALIRGAVYFMLIISSTSSSTFDSIATNASDCLSSFSPCLCITSDDSKLSIDCSDRSLHEWPFVGRRNLSIFRVQALNLSHNQLTSLKSADIVDFGEIKTLDLSFNDRLNIEIDGQWHLPYLENWHLESCGLVSVPSLSGLRNLIYLNIRHNNIGFVSSRDFRPVQRTLRVLDIGHNSLVSFPPDIFPVNSSLRILNVSHNQLENLHRHNFRNLTQLEALNLSHNRIRRLPKDILMQLGRLKDLDLSHNRFRRLEGLSFKGLKALQTLNLDRNRLLSLADGTFWNLSLLTRLQLSDNRLTGVARGWVYGLSGLLTLNLSRNALVRLDPDAWQFCHRLHTLDLSTNRLTTLRPKEFHHLRQLRYLNLRDNHLSMIYGNAFESLAELTTLDLSTNLLADVLISGQQIFLPLRNLRTLNLASNEIRVLPAGVFDGLRLLSMLDLTHNPLVVFSVNALPLPSSLKLVILNTSSLLCDCHLSWLVDVNTFNDDDDDSTENVNTDVPKKRSIQGLAECRHPPELAGKSLLQIPSNVSCESWPRPLVTANPRSTTGLRGQNVSLECKARCQENYVDCHMTIHWRKNGRLIYQEPDTGLTILSQLDESGDNGWRSVLTIEAVDDTDSGWYQCQFANDLASVMSEKAQLVVFVPPSLVKRPVDVAVRVGGTVRLECAATGNPAPTLSWKKDNSGDDFPAARERRMHLMPTDDVFFIVDVKMQDAGVYTCVAKSPAGEDRAQARLNVYNFDDDSTNVGTSVTIPEITVRAGATAVLECSTAPSRSQTIVDEDDEDATNEEDALFLNEMRWTRNGQPLSSSPGSYRTGAGKVWIIKDASPADQGVYACRSTRSNGVASERSWRLVVIATSDEVAKVGPPGMNPIGGSSSSGTSDLEKGVNGNSDSQPSSTHAPPSGTTSRSFFDPTGMPGILAVVIIVCVMVTSLAWVMVIIWRRRRPANSGGVATVVVSLHENTTVGDGQRTVSLLDAKQTIASTDIQPSIQLATVTF